MWIPHNLSDTRIFESFLVQSKILMREPKICRFPFCVREQRVACYDNSRNANTAHLDVAHLADQRVNVLRYKQNILVPVRVSGLQLLAHCIVPSQKQTSGTAAWVVYLEDARLVQNERIRHIHVCHHLPDIVRCKELSSSAFG